MSRYKGFAGVTRARRLGKVMAARVEIDIALQRVRVTDGAATIAEMTLVEAMRELLRNRGFKKLSINGVEV